MSAFIRITVASVVVFMGMGAQGASCIDITGKWSGSCQEHWFNGVAWEKNKGGVILSFDQTGCSKIKASAFSISTDPVEFLLGSTITTIDPQPDPKLKTVTTLLGELDVVETKITLSYRTTTTEKKVGGKLVGLEKGQLDAFFIADTLIVDMFESGESFSPSQRAFSARNHCELKKVN